MEKRSGFKHGGTFERIYRAAETNAQIAAKERKALHVPRNDSERQRRLGLMTSGWSEYSVTLRNEFLTVWKTKIKSADQISRVWNGKGFKTGIGEAWTADLVNFSRAQLFKMRLLTKKRVADVATTRKPAKQ